MQQSTLLSPYSDHKKMEVIGQNIVLHMLDIYRFGKKLIGKKLAWNSIVTAQSINLLYTLIFW